MKVARVRKQSQPIIRNPGGLGGSFQVPATIGSVCDILDVDCTYLAEGDVLTWNGYTWVPEPVTSGRWELAVIPGSPPDTLYADGDWLYILVP